MKDTGQFFCAVAGIQVFGSRFVYVTKTLLIQDMRHSDMNNVMMPPLDVYGIHVFNFVIGFVRRHRKELQ